MLDISKLLNKCWANKTTGWKLKIISDWPVIIGNLHEYARVEKVYDDAVLLGVYDTCWMQELHLLSNIMIKKINLHLGENHIKQIRLKYVEKHEFKPIKQVILTNNSDRKLSEQEKIALEKIQDCDLRLAMQDFLQKCHFKNN